MRRAQITVCTVSITDDLKVTGAHDIPVIADKLFNEVDFSHINFLILPGGMPGSKNLNEHEGLRKLVSEFANNGKDVAAICAAPLVLGGLRLLEGKKATCYPGFEAELIGAITTGENVTVDGNIVTGKGPGLVFDFALTLVEKIAGLGARKEVEDGLLLT